MALILKSIKLSCMQTNCYLVFDSEKKNALVVDPGEYNQALENMLKENKIEKLDYILLTHGHFDHILGTKKLSDNFGGKIVIHKDDEICLRDKTYSLSSPYASGEAVCKADILVADGDKLPFASRDITVIHTPGHTKGGVCYLLENMLFSGDTLFKGTVGRSDFPGGDYKTLLSSAAKLTRLEGNYNVYPGHEDFTTLEEERWSNPYCQ